MITKKQLEKEIDFLDTPKRRGRELAELKATLTQTNEIIKLIENETDQYKQFIHYDIIKKWKDRIITKIKGDEK